MDENRKKELALELKNKRRRKYILIGLAVFVIASAVFGLTIEKKDAKLPDGQESLIAAENTDDSKDKVSEEKKDTKKEDKEAEKNTAADTETAGTASNKTVKKDPSKMTEKEKENTKPSEIAVDNSDDFTASNDGNEVLKPDTPKTVTVTLEIRCDDLSQDLSQLKNPAIKDYIPEDGTVLAATTYTGTTENTVFDALNTICRNNNIHMDFDYSPVFESNYIKGINYIYEQDAGDLSGWMYKVNGWSPNYGCSSYYLSDGDVIQWYYSCSKQ